MKHLTVTIAAATLASLLAQPALADSTLAPGKPAGVHQALQGSTWAALGLGGLVVAGIAIAVATSGNSPAAPVTPPATSTSTAS